VFRCSTLRFTRPPLPCCYSSRCTIHSHANYRSSDALHRQISLVLVARENLAPCAPSAALRMNHITMAYLLHCSIATHQARRQVRQHEIHSKFMQFGNIQLVSCAGSDLLRSFSHNVFSRSHHCVFYGPSCPSCTAHRSKKRKQLLSRCIPRQTSLSLCRRRPNSPCTRQHMQLARCSERTRRAAAMTPARKQVRTSPNFEFSADFLATSMCRIAFTLQ